MKLYPLIFASALIMCSCAKTNDAPSLLPKPQEIAMGAGEYALAKDAKIALQGVDSIDARRILAMAQTIMPEAEIAADGEEAGIVLTVAGEGNPEGYDLKVTSGGITLDAHSPAGLFYGLQTLAQSADENGNVPAMEISDAPRLGYRGLMLDISRHFRDADFIRKQIDAMAALKLNRLHLHLTDDAGWRIEIESHPELTEYAAWRPQETWTEWAENGAKYCHASDPNAHGGYLTKQEARELVEYAADRYITIIPEIEMPGHSAEVTAAIPEIGCDVVQGRHSDLCVGNEKTFEVFQDVLTEIFEIFPSEYVHIGGDEAGKQAWKNCPKCQKRMKDENLADVDELQSYMITRMEKWVNEHGRNIIGWDEILEGGLAPNATVMSWRGTEGGVKAANMNHDVIMVPGAYCYLDSHQDSPSTQPEAFGGYLPIEKVYSYNPAPDSLGAEVNKHIIGVQGNIWAEKIPTGDYMEYLLYPRLLAIAEIGWTPQEMRDYADFRPRAVKFVEGMRQKGYNAFDLSKEVGNRPESKEPVEHLALGKKVTYNVPWWTNYTAQGETTLTDGNCGGWNYNDGKWQGFLASKGEAFDVVIDLEESQPIGYIGATFMQVCGPGVWMPSKVVISVSEDGENFTEVSTIDHEQVKDTGWSYEPYEWKAATDADKVNARYVRYQAYTPQGCLFTDEIIVK